MITNITLENFKCFRHVSINPKLLTVLIGPNGTGKSSILQALLLLKQSVGEEQLNMQGGQVNFPAASTIGPGFLHEASFFRIVLVGVDINSPPPVAYNYGAIISPSGVVEESFGALTSSIEGHSVEIRVDENDPTANGIIAVDGYRGEMDRLGVIGSLVNDESECHWQWGELMPHLEILDEVLDIATVPLSVLEELKVVPATRGFVRSQYPLGNVEYQNVSLSNGLSGQEEETASNLGYGRRLEGRLSELLQRITGTGMRADTVPPQSVAINSLTPSGAVNIVAEGFGTNALILLFQQLIAAEKDATILVEEPEIHLHPKAQAELAEVLAETAKAEDKQIIMTTHSEHLVERLLLLVAEGTLEADDLAIYSFSKDEKGECFAAEIQVTENGQVEGGLTDFYANNLDTLDRRVKALRRSE